MVSLIVLEVTDIFGAVIGFLAGIVMEFGFVLYLFLVAVPCYCLLYGKRILRNEKRKYLFAFYNSFVLTLFCFFSFCKEEETLTYSTLLFFGAVLWSVLPLLLPRKTDKTSKE